MLEKMMRQQSTIILQAWKRELTKKLNRSPEQENDLRIITDELTLRFKNGTC